MPILKICAEPGCFARTSSTRCPEHQRSYTRMRNSRLEHLAHTTPEYRRLRAQVLSDHGYVCGWCGDPATELDFIVPLALGGEAVYENATASCKPCNASRGATVRRGVRVD